MKVKLLVNTDASKERIESPYRRDTGIYTGSDASKERIERKEVKGC